MTRSRAPKGWTPPPALYAWQQRVLRLVLEEPGISTAQLGERYYPAGPRSQRGQVALHELLVLERGNLVQRCRGRWSPALMAAEVLRIAGQSAPLRPAP